MGGIRRRPQPSTNHHTQVITHRSSHVYEDTQTSTFPSHADYFYSRHFVHNVILF